MWGRWSGALRRGGAAREPAHGVCGARRGSAAGDPRRRARCGLRWRSLGCSEEELAGVLATAAGAGFALDREPPLRAHLYGLSAREHVLLLVLHHIAGDGWSLGVLLRDVARCYGARRAGGAPGLAPLAVQYADYTLWQQEVLGERERGGERDLAPALVLAGAAGRACRSRSSFRATVRALRWRATVAGSVGLALDGELHAGLLRLARDCGSEPVHGAAGGLVGLLTRLGAGSDIALGSPIAGRTDSALDDLVGFFVNTLVLRTDASGNPSMRRADWAGARGQSVGLQPCRMCRLSGWLRCSTLRGRWRAIRCSR